MGRLEKKQKRMLCSWTRTISKVIMQKKFVLVKSEEHVSFFRRLRKGMREKNSSAFDTQEILSELHNVG